MQSGRGARHPDLGTGHCFPVWLGSLPDLIRIHRGRDLESLEGAKKQVQPNRLALTTEMKSLLESLYVEEASYDYEGTAVHGIGYLKPCFQYNALCNLDCTQEHQRAFFARLAPGVNHVGHMFFFRWWIIYP